MIEMMVLSACFKLSVDTCKTVSTAYYKQSGIEEVLQRREKELAERHKSMAMIVASIGLFSSKTVTINLGSGSLILLKIPDQSIGFSLTF